MLSACASSPTPPAPPPTEPDPVIETRVQTRLVCPAELSRSPGERPAVPADAVLTANEPAAAWLAAALAFVDAVLSLFEDAAAACSREVADAR